MKSNLVFIGMPGSGKSTLGKRVAKAMQMRFQDTDDLIEQNEGKRLQQILNRHGMRYFRSAEEKAVCQLEVENCVISTGGSVVYSDIAMQHLQTIGYIVYLKISPATLQRRVQNVSERGLFKPPRQSLFELYFERAAMYENWADICLDNNRTLTALQLDSHVASVKDVFNNNHV